MNSFIKYFKQKQMRSRNQDYNLLPIAQDYFQNIFSEISGMKALLLDRQTSGIISVVYTQSKLYKNDIYLIQKIDDDTEKLTHLKALYFVRPTPENIDLICKEVDEPRFHQYHLFFTNEIDGKMIDRLAQADKSDKIKNIQEIYLDYYALGHNVYSLNIPSTITLSKRPELWEPKDKEIIKRMSDGLISLVMSLRLMPQVRYLSGSASCAQVADRLARKMEIQLAEKQSDYRLNEQAIVLITERKEDVITPLLTPWTYQSMLHQFIGIFNNKVDIVNKQKAFLNEHKPTTSIKEKEEREFVLSETSDDFYRKNVNNGFGQLANNIKTFISEVSQKRHRTVKLQSLEDMHEALDKIPELNALSATLQKHVTLSCQLSEQIEKGVLFEVSKVEQDLVCQDSRSSNIEAIWRTLKNEKIDYYLKFKLLLIFSTKYPNDKQTKEFLNYLGEMSNDKSMLSLVHLLAQFQSGRRSDLFHQNNLKKKAKSYFERMLKDVPNVYTQHKPHVFEETIPDIITKKIKQHDYPSAFNGRQAMTPQKPIIILFYVGGATYTEAKQADEYENAKVIVGGSFIHNSKTFIGEVIQLQTMLQ